MKEYPSIPHLKEPINFPAYMFHKYDGSNFRAEWSAKKGVNTIQCSICCNSTLNPRIRIGAEGTCNVCNNYLRNKTNSTDEVDFVKGLKGKEVLLGMSGGKDSTAAAFTLKSMGIKPRCFTFDIGYYPKHIFDRSSYYSGMLELPHEIIDIRHYISENSRKCYQLTADLYENKIQINWKNIYQLNKRNYSVKNDTVMPYVRSCQLCRKTVIKAYVGEAHKRSINYVVLGMNEWANLAGNSIGGIRKLKPYAELPEIYIIHLPFILNERSFHTKQICDYIGWTAPQEEEFVETNGNSCLFARAAEYQAFNKLGFHPDTTRLSREVTVGFLNKEEALQKLVAPRPYEKSVRQVLEEANVV